MSTSLADEFEDVFDRTLAVGIQRFEDMVYAGEFELPVRCRVCGCTDLLGCEGGCSWVEEDLCSTCAELEDEAMRLVMEAA